MRRRRIVAVALDGWAATRLSVRGPRHHVSELLADALRAESHHHVVQHTVKGGIAQRRVRSVARWLRYQADPNHALVIVAKSFGAWNVIDALRKAKIKRGDYAAIGVVTVDVQRGLLNRNRTTRVLIPAVDIAVNFYQDGAMGGALLRATDGSCTTIDNQVAGGRHRDLEENPRVYRAIRQVIAKVTSA